MIELCLLGTAAMMPLPERRLAALLIRRNGRLLLIDCGEGPQVAVRQSGWSLARIDTICITHFHADHIAGLPGLLLTMGTAGRKKPVTLIGPKGLFPVVQCLRVIAPELPYPLWFEELDGPSHQTAFQDTLLSCFLLDHIIPCYGYSLALNRQGRFRRGEAEALGIPPALWGTLQQGKPVNVGERIFTPDQVLSPPRPGIKLAYCTDTRPVESIPLHGADADLLILEGTYADEGRADKARQYGHMTFAQAATQAKAAGAKELLLTHFSPTIIDMEAALATARGIFTDTYAGEDGMKRTLLFPEE